MDTTQRGIGTLAEATTAYWLCTDPDLEPAEGYRIIGIGAHRTVVLAPSGTVYKVSRGARGIRPNRREAAQMRAWREQGATCIPATDLYAVEAEWGDVVPVVAMEHIVADDTEADWTQALRLQAEAGTLDLNGDNIIVRDGVAWIIDAGGIDA